MAPCPLPHQWNEFVIETLNAMEFILRDVSNLLEGRYLVGHEKLGSSSIYGQNPNEQLAWLFVGRLQSSVVRHEV